MPKTAALRAAVFKLFTKKLMGGVFKHPPSGALVNLYWVKLKLKRDHLKYGEVA